MQVRSTAWGEDMHDAIYAKLAESPGQILKHPHSGADYYTGETIITHLNRALGPFNWDWHPLDRGFDTDADEVWATGRLTARYFDGEAWFTTVKEATGWQVVNRKRNGGGFVSLGNDYKGADTDALKRAARLLGVGLDAWAKDAPVVYDEAPRQPKPAPQKPAAPKPTPIRQQQPAPSRDDLIAQYRKVAQQAIDAGHRQAADLIASKPEEMPDEKLIAIGDGLVKWLKKQQAAG